MLILTKRVGETVVIGRDITVTVLGVKGSQVRVGVDAPKEVAVHREEVYERIKREEAAAHSSKPPYLSRQVEVRTMVKKTERGQSGEPALTFDPVRVAERCVFR